MPVTTDEILARGNGPVQPTWADQPTQAAAPVTPTQPTVATDEPTDVEDVNYNTVMMQGAPDNPKNAHEVVGRGVVKVANPQVQQPQTTTDTEQVTRVSEQQKGSDEGFYTRFFRENSDFTPKTKEEIEQERKRQKRRSIFAAIGDGISALSNLYFTTQYAPNAFEASKGMSVTTRARFDKLKKEYEERSREYLNGLTRAMQMDETSGYKQALAELKEREQTRKESETNIKLQLKQADLDYKEAKKTGQEYMNELYRLKGAALAKGMDAQVELIEEKIKTEKAKQKKYSDGGSGGSRKRGPKLQLENDEPLRFDNTTDYDRTVMRLAHDYNVPTTTEEVTEWGNEYDPDTKTSKRVPRKKRTVKRPVKDIAADIEREAKKRKNSNNDDFAQYEVGGAEDEFSQYEKK